jgi:hypothetical protein
VPYLISDLQAILHQEMGKLEKSTTTAPYIRLKTRLEELRGDPRFNFLFSGMLVGDTMVDVLSRMFRLPAGGQPIAIIDVSGVPSEVTSTVVALLSRLVFDFSIWAREEETRPILLVCEEAHRYVPNEKNADGSSVGRILSRIAKEGRKYGVSLGLVTQRPSDLAEGVLSQCGTIIAMRLNNERDQAFVRAAMPEGARGFLDSIPPCATANASSAAKAWRSRCASPLTIWRRSSGPPRPTHPSAGCGAKGAMITTWCAAPSSAGAPRGVKSAFLWRNLAPVAAQIDRAGHHHRHHGAERISVPQRFGAEIGNAAKQKPTRAGYIATNMMTSGMITAP